MNKIIRNLFWMVLIFPSIVFAEPTPVGLWQSYDLNKNVRNIVKFSLKNGKLMGNIVKVKSLRGEKALCDVCVGPWHNKPLLGLPIIWGLKKLGNKWVNGQVVNVDNGKIYNCQLSVSDDNKIMNFTGYLGIPAFGATVQWMRVNT